MKLPPLTPKLKAAAIAKRAGLVAKREAILDADAVTSHWHKQHRISLKEGRSLEDTIDPGDDNSVLKLILHRTKAELYGLRLAGAGFAVSGAADLDDDEEPVAPERRADVEALRALLRNFGNFVEPILEPLYDQILADTAQLLAPLHRDSASAALAAKSSAPVLAFAHFKGTRWGQLLDVAGEAALALKLLDSLIDGTFEWSCEKQSAA